MGRGESGSEALTSDVWFDPAVNALLDGYGDRVGHWTVPVDGDDEVVIRLMLTDGSVDEWRLTADGESELLRSEPATAGGSSA